MPKTLFISDLHFGHKNVLSFDNRPFSSIEAHDQKLIENWNKRVSSEDTVYILGDVSWYKPGKTIEILDQMHGRKCLIKGNHDGHLLKSQDLRSRFDEILDYKELVLEYDRHVILCHYPIPCFKNHYYGAFHLYGHVHNGFEHNMMEHVKREMLSLYSKPCNMYNVGCMMPYMNYTPRTLNEIVIKYEAEACREEADSIEK